MDKHMIRTAAAAAALWLAAVPAMAVVLAGAAPLSGPDGNQSDAGAPGLLQAIGPSTAGTVQSIVWWGFHGPNSRGDSFDNFLVELNGQVVTGTLTQALDVNVDVIRYELDIPDMAWSGAPGSLSVTNDSFDVEWFWQYAVSGQVQAFELIGEASNVPEPLSLGLALVALAGLTASRRVAR